MRAFRGGYRKIDGQWYAIIWDGVTGEELKREPFEPKPDPWMKILANAKCKKGEVTGRQFKIPLMGNVERF